ncbi:hypothetical protein HMN09_00686300 [Mycena chlorophos]|uniref:DUF6534 domain-containing protein n=1 Tax=Mycena chlorophos TaxID=658473 RepID=A0A8H6T106_MYCCL|nr:hypothetical protein HMN09_00686300 [Mycena chlorophos]
MSSVIHLVPASQAFVDNRTTSLGSWVIAGFTDAILLGVVLCQVANFFRSNSRRSQEGIGRYYRWLVVVVTFLSLIKTAQSIAIVWVQNVADYMNPDVARTLVAKAWWQVSPPTITAITGIIVQSFFALRFYMLARNIWVVIPIVCSMLLGFAGVCLSLNSIIIGNAKAKVMWLLVHLICVFASDFMITCGTVWALSKRTNGGLPETVSLINRLMRLVFESAAPPTVAAAIDLIMTQTLGQQHLLWHLLLNYTLAKLYAISLLYTLNSINEYREYLSGERVISSGSHGQISGTQYRTGSGAKRADMEMGNVRSNLRSAGEVYVQTQIITQVSPSIEEPDRHIIMDDKTSGWKPDWDQ